MKTKGIAQIRIIGILLIGGLAIGLWQLLLAPRFTEPLEVGTRTEEALTLLAGLEQQIDALEERASRLGEVQARADELAILLPPTAEVPQLVLFINQAAARAGLSASQVLTVRTDALTPQVVATSTSTASAADTEAAQDVEDTDTADSTAPAPVAGEAPYVMPVTVTAIGSWRELMAFVLELQRAERALLVKNVDIKIEAVDGAQFELTVQAEGLVVRALGSAPALPSGITPLTQPSASPTPSGAPTPSPTPSGTPAG
jgi:Tfp pilus assembly protein PilO